MGTTLQAGWAGRAKAPARTAARARRARALVFVCFALMLAGALGAFTVGPVSLDLPAAIAAAWGPAADVTPSAAFDLQVLAGIRAPRTLLALLAGASLALAGAVMQGVFRNPLADPALIGVSAGGALGAVSVIVLGPLFGAALIGSFALPGAAFVGAIAATALVYGVSRDGDGSVSVPTMLLAGVAVNAFAFALIGTLTFLSDESQLRMLTFWTLGSVGGAGWDVSWPALLLMAVALPWLASLGTALNAFSLGEHDAAHLGVDTTALKRRAAALTAIAVGAAVSACGTIGFIGLVTPHLFRLMAGPDHRFLLPGSAALGAALLVTADTLARLLVSPAELPLGVMTALLGAPFFFWLLLRGRRGAW